MRRRGVLAGALAGLAMPRVARAAVVVNFVPLADMSSIDPVWTTLTSTRNHGHMVFDTLFATDASLRIEPQMAEGMEVSSDGRGVRIRLREGLRFHDGAPVLARDCVASLRRWAPRDPLGRRLLAVTESLVAGDDRTIVFALREPFPLLAYALGKMSTPLPLMMPEAVIAEAGAGPIRRAVGSGPFRFLADEWVTGSRAVYERFEGYVPRAEAPSGTAGGKRVHVDRVVWMTIPDPTTAAGALRTGAADWWEWPSQDLVPVLERDANVCVADADPLGFVTIGRMNHRQKPFSDPKVRQAFAAALDQNDFMAAAMGDRRFYRTCTAFMPCGSPYAREAPSPIAGDLALGRRLLAESSYDGTPAVILSASDSTVLSGCCAVAADLMQKLGMKTDLQTLDVGGLMRRRASEAPVDKGGWSFFVTAGGAVGTSNPVDFTWLQADPALPVVGWPDDAAVRAAMARFAAAGSEAERQVAAGAVQAAAAADVPYLPLGQYRQQTAYRAVLRDVLPAGVPLFWNLRKG